jgi:hypothetical protein
MIPFGKELYLLARVFKGSLKNIMKLLMFDYHKNIL